MEERDSPYMHAPVWPWSLAGWVIAGTIVLMFIVAWGRS
jgi:hypothetical protein